MPLFAGTPVQETAREFSAAGDFNGDGAADVLVLDKTSGVYRIGYGSTGGALTFAEGRPSGLGGATGCAVGKLAGTARDSFAVTEPAANRAHILSPQTPGYTEPKAAYDAGVGAALLAAFDMPAGPGGTAEDDLAVFTTLDPTMGTQLCTLRSNAGAWTLLNQTDAPDEEPAHGNPLTPAAGAAPLFAYTSRGGAADSFHAWQMTGAATSEVLALGGLPASTEFVAGTFEPPRADVLFYKPGDATVRVRRIVPGAPWSFSAETSATFSEAVEQLAVVNDPAGARVLARFANGAVALFGYTQAGGFSTPQPIEPSGVNGVLSGLVPMPGNAFQLLFAPAAGEASATVVTFKNSGGGWTQTAVTAMSPHLPLRASANVLLLTGAPFRAPNVPVVRTYRAADWSTSVAVGGGPFSVSAQAGSYGGETSGIGAPAAQTLGTATSVPGGTAVNQAHAQFSLFSFGTTLGAAVEDVAISPAPGTYAAAVRVTFSGMSGGSTVFYRRDAGAPFTAWSAASAPWIFSPTSVEYHVRTAAGVTSPTRSARYEFSKPPALQDADGDGVPDFVEAARGLSPAGGADSDGDGFSDRDELAAGTNPNSAASKPATAAPAPGTLLVDIAAKLQDVLETSGGTTVTTTAVAADGVAVTLRDPFGNPAGSGAVGTPAGFARVTAATVPEMEYLVARTPEHFDVTPPGGNPRHGREMVALVPVPPREPWAFGTLTSTGPTLTVQAPWSWGGLNWLAGSTNWDAGLGEPESFAAGWTASQTAPQWGSAAAGYTAGAWETQFRAASNRGAQAYAQVTLTPVTSLAAVIAGKLIGDQLAARSGATVDGPSLAFDAPLAPVFQSLRLADPAHANAPALRVQSLLAQLDAALAGTDTSAAALRKIARSVYARHQALAPENLASLPMPLAALATFLRTGTLPAEYDLSGTGLTAADLTAANAKLAAFTASLAARPSALFTLATRSTPSPIGLTLVQNSTGALFSLLNADLTATVLPAALPPGTPLRITAYTDLASVAGAMMLEVRSLEIASLPLFVGEDADGDLLADEWERRHFGSLGHDSLESLDGSPYSLLQEYLDGTSPLLAASSPPFAPVELRLTDLRLAIESGTPRLRVRWPAGYMAAITVSFDTSPDLVHWTDDPAFSATPAAGSFTRDVTLTGPRGFYRAHARLKR